MLRFQNQKRDFTIPCCVSYVFSNNDSSGRTPSNINVIYCEALPLLVLFLVIQKRR